MIPEFDAETGMPVGLTPMMFDDEGNPILFMNEEEQPIILSP